MEGLNSWPLEALVNDCCSASLLPAELNSKWPNLAACPALSDIPSKYLCTCWGISSIPGFHPLTRHPEAVVSTAKSFNIWGLWKLTVVWQHIEVLSSTFVSKTLLASHCPKLFQTSAHQQRQPVLDSLLCALEKHRFQPVRAMALSEPLTGLVTALSRFVVIFSVHLSTCQILFSWFWQSLSRGRKTNMYGDSFLGGGKKKSALID